MEKYTPDFVLDKLDWQILDELKKNSKQGTKTIAEKIGLTNTPTFERIKRLERVGIIKGYNVDIDSKKLGLNLSVFCYVQLKAHNIEIIEAFEKQVVLLEEVKHCFHLAGKYDYSLYIEIADIDAYQQFLKEKLAIIPDIVNVQSSFVMSQLK